MAKIKDLNDLLSHEIKALYSAAGQLISGMEAMAKKAGDTGLNKSLEKHLDIARQQKIRLDKVKELLKGDDKAVGAKKQEVSTDASSRKKAVESEGGVAGTVRGRKAASKRPSANVESPGGRAGTSHRGNRGH